MVNRTSAMGLTLIDWAKRLDPTGNTARLVEDLNRPNPMLGSIELAPQVDPGAWPMFLDPDVAALEARFVEEQAWEWACKEWWGRPSLFSVKES
jgi:hypothetical protein